MSAPITKKHIDAILKMSHSHIRNYVLPGLKSSLLGDSGKNGLVRILQGSCYQFEAVTPHSHRFDFVCQVLSGQVKNYVWKKALPMDYAEASDYQSTTLHYLGEIGNYATEPGPIEKWTWHSTDYAAGDWYSMKADEVHSIRFSRDAVVLFFEGPQISDKSIALEPVVDGGVIPTLLVKPWMFLKDFAL